MKSKVRGHSDRLLTDETDHKDYEETVDKEKMDKPLETRSLPRLNQGLESE